MPNKHPSTNEYQASSQFYGHDIAGRVNDGAFIRLVFPFYTKKNRTAKLDATIAITKLKKQSVVSEEEELWKEIKFNLEDPLKHIASQLEAKNKDADVRDPLVRSWQLSKDGYDTLVANKTREWTVNKWSDKELSTSFGCRFSKKESVRLDWFRSNVVFLTFTLEAPHLIKSPGKSSEQFFGPGDWLDFINYAREDGRKGYETVCRPKETHESNADYESSCDWLDFINYARDDGRKGYETVCRPKETHESYSDNENARSSNRNTEDAALQGYSLTQLRDALLRRTYGADSISEISENICWTGAFSDKRFLTYSYATIDAVPESDVGTFLYAVHSGFHSRQLLIPSAAQRSLGEPHVHEYAESYWMLASLERSAVVACNASASQEEKFFHETLPQHVRSQYFSLYLLALQQRFALLDLSQQITAESIESVLSDASDLDRMAQYRKVLSSLRRKVLDFYVRASFRHVSQRDHHQAYFQRWCSVLDVETLLEEVRSEYEELDAFVEAKSREAQLAHDRMVEHEQADAEEKRLKREREAEGDRQVFGFFVSVLALPGLALTYLQVASPTGDEKAAHNANVAVLAALVVAVAIGVTFPRIMRAMRRLLSVLRRTEAK